MTQRRSHRMAPSGQLPLPFPALTPSSRIAALRVGDVVRLRFPAVRGAPRRGWMKERLVRFRVSERLDENRVEVEPVCPRQPRGTLYERPGFAAAERAAGHDTPDALDRMLALYGRDGLGHTTGHPTELLPHSAGEGR